MYVDVITHSFLMRIVYPLASDDNTRHPTDHFPWNDVTPRESRAVVHLVVMSHRQ